MKFNWSSENLSDRGILIGADLTQEWLLPWWWDNYSCNASFPVAFADFGMSAEAKKWCEDRGRLLSLGIPAIFVAERHEIDAALVSEMEAACGNGFWPSRNAWFKKPMACLNSPFSETIWIDLDCEIRLPLNDLFLFLKEPVALAKETFHCSDSEIYNAGVILFKKGSQMIEEWAEQSFEQNHLFRGDQDVLNTIIKKFPSKITELPEIYNWSRLKGKNPKAIILHWHGPQGKAEISHQIACRNLKTLCYL